MAGDQYREHASETVDRLDRTFRSFLDGRGISEGSAATAGAIWEAFLAFAREKVTHRGAPIRHEFIQVEMAGESLVLSRIISLEDDAEDYEGEAICFIETDVPGAEPLDEDLQGVTPSGPAGDLHPYGEGEDHEYQSLEELDRVVRTRILRSTFASSASVTAIDASGG